MYHCKLDLYIIDNSRADKLKEHIFFIYLVCTCPQVTAGAGV